MNLRFLQPLYQAAGPVATVYMDTSRAGEDSAHRIAQRWRCLREELSESGADKNTLEALDSAAGGLAGIPGPQGEALFASSGKLIAAYTLSQPPSQNHAELLPVPDPVDLVGDLDDGLPYVVVAVDREGADVYAYPSHGDLSTLRHSGGSVQHAGNVPAVGWQRQHHRRHHAEELSFANAAEVARGVEEAVTAVQATAVFVGGNDGAFDRLGEHMSDHTAEMLIPVSDGDRSDPGAIAELRRSVEEGLNRTAVALRAGLIEDFGREVERGGRAVQGFGPTCEALRSGRVRRLLLAGDRDHEPDLWASSSDPLEVAEDRGRLTDPAEGFCAPAGSLLLRAAQAGNSSFTRLPSRDDARQGVGAFTRFSAAV